MNAPVTARGHWHVLVDDGRGRKEHKAHLEIGALGFGEAHGDQGDVCVWGR